MTTALNTRSSLINLRVQRNSLFGDWFSSACSSCRSQGSCSYHRLSFTAKNFRPTLKCLSPTFPSRKLACLITRLFKLLTQCFFPVTLDLRQSLVILSKRPINKWLKWTWDARWTPCANLTLFSFRDCNCFHFVWILACASTWFLLFGVRSHPPPIEQNTTTLCAWLSRVSWWHI